jgi:alpha-glucosidase
MAEASGIGPRQIAIDDPDWWRGAVIYQIYPRSFQDTNEDGVGDLAGIAARLPYVADLGVDAVWISPFFRSPMKDFGYDVADYRDVDPLFGTLSDFDHLLAEAHRLGLKVMIDQVLSHTSDRHAWFAESRSSRDNPRAGWYVWADPKPDGTPPNNWLSVFGGPAWEWDSTRRQYYLHNFLVEQPDLNHHMSEVRAAILDEVRFWLERGVDGFRLDAVNFTYHSAGLEDNPPADREDDLLTPRVNPYSYQHHVFDKNRPETLSFLEAFRALLDRYPGAAALGEIGEAKRGLDLMAAYAAPGRLHMCYSFEFLTDPFSREHFETGVRRFEDAAGEGWPCWAFSNHDVVRHVSRWRNPTRDGKRFAKFCAALLLSLRGSVCLYQGEELGLPEAELSFDELRDPYGIRFWPEYKGRDGARTPFPWQANAPHAGFSDARPWLPVSPAHLRLAADRQEDDPESVLHFIRAFLRFRRAHPALVKGGIAFLPSEGEVLAFRREGESERLACAFNLGGEKAVWAPPRGVPLRRLDGYGLDDSVKAEGGIALPPLGVFIAEIEGGDHAA